MASISTAALAYTAIASSVIGAGVAAYGSYQQGRAAEAAAEYNAELRQNEAKIRELEGIENARRQRRENRRYISRQRALFAARGVALEGTVLEILGKSAGILELNVQDAFRQSGIEAGYARSQAQQSLYAGRQARTAANYQAAGSLLSGTISTANTYSSVQPLLT